MIIVYVKWKMRGITLIWRPGPICSYASSSPKSIETYAAYWKKFVLKRVYKRDTMIKDVHICQIT